MIKDCISVLITKKYIDHYEHVNHAHYQDLFEGAQNTFLVRRNVSFKYIQNTYKIRFVQRAFSIEFIKPLYLKDEIIIETSISQIGFTSFLFNQLIKKNNKVVTIAKTVYVAVNAKNNKVTLPDDIRSKMELF